MPIKPLHCLDRSAASPTRQGGFSLIEIVVVIVLLGILAAGAGLLISRPIESYSDQARRQQLVDAAEMALRKIATDVRRALPNSIRIDDSDVPNSWALEMINTVDGARYRDEAGGPFGLADHILDFTVADQRFNILGSFSNNPAGALRAVIYSTNSVDVYVDAAAGLANGVITRAGVNIGAAVNDEQPITLTAGPHLFDFQSPGQRLFLVDVPISYTCDSATGRLMRFAGYDFQAAQVVAADDLDDLSNVQFGQVVSNASGCAIDYDPGTPTRAGLLTLDLTLSEGNESVRLLHQLHVDNLP